MARTPRWLDKQALLLLHNESIATFGGSPGLRDEGLLASALERPRNLHVLGGVSDLAGLAAAYGFGLARNHPFIDGNKRAALLAIGVFLGINRRRLVAPPIEAYAAMTSLAAGEMDEAMLAAWVRRHSTRRPAT
jgi:death-on-curing protein